MFRPTAEQSGILEAAGHDTSVRSGAGCGKTAVLALKLLQAMDLHDRDPLAVLALTFSEKAARELRGRVRDYLSAGEIPAGEIVPESLLIGTFHGFCRRLLARYSVEAGVEPDFLTLDGRESAALRRLAIRAVVRESLRGEAGGTVELGIEYGLDPLLGIVEALLGRAGADDLGAWASRSDEERIGAWRDAWTHVGLPIVTRDLRAPLGRAIRGLEAHAPDHPVMRQRQSILVESLPLLDDGRDLAGVLKSIDEAARVQGVTKKLWGDEDAYEGVKATLEVLRGVTKKLLARTTIDEEADRNAAWLSTRLAGLTSRCRQEYERRKRRLGALDFEDLIDRALRLIRERPGLIDRSGLARFILVDEFQDTDTIQGAIIDRLAAGNPGRARLFLVGDSKQSIYRFRGASPAVFDEFRARFPEEGRKDLTRNFRSDPEILRFVNHLFGRVFVDDPPLRPGDEREADSAAEGGPQAVTVVRPDDPDPDAKSTPAETRRAIEARWLAALVAGRLAGGWALGDRRGGEARDAGPDDVVFLFRTLRDAEVYRRALERRGLSARVVGDPSHATQQEAVDIKNLLATIDDPTDTLSLLSTLRGPFFGVSDRGLFWLGTARLSEEFGDQFQSGYHGFRGLPHLDEADRRRIGRAHDLLGRWRALKDRVPVAALLRQIVEESGIREALDLLDGRRLRSARLDPILALASTFESPGYRTLGDFVTFLRAARDDAPADHSAPSPDGDRAIRFMTIHQSKGLEFPVVVLPELHREPPGNREQVAWDAGLGVVVRRGVLSRLASERREREGANVGWLAYETARSHQEREEALRLFYVATTRAKSHLILSAFHDRRQTDPASPALRLLSERFELATGRPADDARDDDRSPLFAVIDAEPTTG